MQSMAVVVAILYMTVFTIVLDN